MSGGCLGAGQDVKEGGDEEGGTDEEESRTQGIRGTMMAIKTMECE